MTEHTELSRRSILKGLTGAGATGLLGGAALFAASGPAAASSYSITGSSAELDDGQLSYVDVDVAGNLTWDGFDTPVKYLRFVAEITIDDGGSTPWHTLADSTSDALPDGWSGNGDSDGWGGAGEYVISYGGDTEGTQGEVHTDAQWRVIGDTGKSIETPAPWQDNLSVDTDGNQQTFTLNKRNTVYFLDTDKNQIGHDLGGPENGAVRSVTSFDVTVTNQASTTGGSTDGTSDAG